MFVETVCNEEVCICYNSFLKNNYSFLQKLFKIIWFPLCSVYKVKLKKALCLSLLWFDAKFWRMNDVKMFIALTRVQSKCFHCVRLYVRTVNIIEKIESEFLTSSQLQKKWICWSYSCCCRYCCSCCSCGCSWCCCCSYFCSYYSCCYFCFVLLMLLLFCVVVFMVMS